MTPPTKQRAEDKGKAADNNAQFADQPEASVMVQHCIRRVP